MKLEDGANRNHFCKMYLRSHLTHWAERPDWQLSPMLLNYSKS